jgi:hypothetical protein
MKKIIFIISLITNNMVSYSQQAIPETLVYRDSVSHFYALKDSVIQTRQDRFGRTTYISINGRTTDSIKTNYGNFGQIISSNDKKRKDVIYNGGDYYKLSIETGKLDTILLRKENESYDVAIGNILYGCAEKIDTTFGNYLISYDMLTGKKELLCNIEDDYNIGSVEALINGLLLVSVVNFSEEHMFYYSYHISTNSLIKMDYSNYIKDMYGNSDIYYDDISGEYLIMGNFWIDVSFNIVQSALRRTTYERGFKIKETDSYYYLKSEIDEPLRKNGSNAVWLACRFTLPFDMCLYKIYNNELLTKQEISEFDEWELHKLKNMVFAKHDYKFESLYLQAFYNLFAFYDGKYKDVSHLLTPEDKKNLELIQEAGKK